MDLSTFTDEELKAELYDRGYYVTKKPYHPKKDPCVCGRKYVELWSDWSSDRRKLFFRCPKCGLRSESAETRSGAVDNWNELVRKRRNHHELSLKPGELPTWISVEDELPSSIFTEGYSCIVLSTENGKHYTISEAVYFPDLKEVVEDDYRYFYGEEIQNVTSGFFREYYNELTETYEYDLLQNVTHWMRMSYRVDR